ncbi:M10 family metallopeptidase [Candidatus Liberibacter solanacearum]|uniref:M10 family metallopeptidase n=1 Tax=Candidatus Liberibacter solanacearum TaxID=556287 RepID=UPI000B225454|nr:M10 family metallopeptidase [Candidatus Liberibacter solanacearum]
MDDIKPVYTTETIADYLLRDSYWTNYFLKYQPTVYTDHRLFFDVTELNANGQEIVRWAFREWSKIVNITFEETSNLSDIKFKSNDFGYICIPKNNVRYFMEINLDARDVYFYGIDKGTILSHNTIHEIGHALGLMHAGPYNGGSPTYGVDNQYANDSFLTSVMSYFNQNENHTTDASFGYCATPMVADIVAVQKIYGAPKTLVGDTIHKIEVKQGYSPFIQTIYDSGGSDLLDVQSVGTFDNYIDLNPESWSSIGGYKKNVTIARDTIIESVIGGTGNDTIIGNSANNTLFKSGGNDTFYGADGCDVMVYSMLKNDYKIYRFKNEAIIYDMFRNEVDDIRDVELLRFSNDHIYLADIKQQSILEYTASYGDLVQCIGNDVNASKKHFVDFGLREGRDITFNPYLYLGSYDDLRQVFGSDKDSATRHYITHGFREGRNPDEFKALEYIASHADLINAYTHTEDLVQSGKQHFSTFGYFENRSVTFNPYLYLGGYDDLRQVFGSDKDSATRHYITHGFREGRNPGFMYRDDSMQHSFSLSEKSQEHKYTSTFFDPKEDLSENFFEWPNSFQDTILDFSE